MPSRYLGLQNLRRINFVQALIAVRAELRDVRPSHPEVPKVYAVRLLEADDEFGARDGLVVQGDGVSWTMIDALFDLAVIGGKLHRTRHRGGADTDCALCRQVDDIHSVDIAQRIKDRRQHLG